MTSGKPGNGASYILLQLEHKLKGLKKEEREVSLTWREMDEFCPNSSTKSDKAMANVHFALAQPLPQETIPT